jgi:hypothetical protein
MAGALTWGEMMQTRRSLTLVSLTVVMLVVAGSAGADQSYTDPTGDAGAGTDIVALTVRNDAAGNISIQVASASPIVANHAIAIFIDADRNASTGSSSGDEYWMYGGPDVGIAFFVWNGSQFVQTSPASFRAGAAATNVNDFRINRADLGNTSGFNFDAISISIDGSNINFWDHAPNSGSYSYVLASPPPPPPTTTTTPKPKPPTITRPDPNKLPTIFGPSKRSRKDPEYSRFATRMAGGPRSVFCWSESDWARLTPKSKTTIAFGYVEFRSPRQINLAPNVCAVLDRIHYQHQQPPITPAIAFGLVTFTHEMFHTLGVTNEAAAQCYGMQVADQASRLLGAGATYGERVAQLAWRLYGPRVLLPQYLSRECHDGGKLDLFPKSHVWP